MIVVALPMLLVLARSVMLAVPVVLHKEDALAASVVFAAVLAPMFGIAIAGVTVFKYLWFAPQKNSDR